MAAAKKATASLKSKTTPVSSFFEAFAEEDYDGEIVSNGKSLESAVEYAAEQWGEEAKYYNVYKTVFIGKFRRKKLLEEIKE